jgi:hypothetical protein
MNILAASAMLPLRRRLDWRQGHLSYVPRMAYELVETRRMRLLRRFRDQFLRLGRRLL